jgi:hypothetical protein
MSDQITIIKKDNLITVVETPNQVNVSTSGMQGPIGSSILNGVGLPSNSIGQIGDYYLDSQTDILYGPKTESGWPSGGILLKGTTGLDGAQGVKGDKGYSVYTGASSPSNSLGNNGDVYIHSVANIIYTKVGGVWTNAQEIASKSNWSYTHEQQANSTVWNVTHNLGYKPSVDIIDYGNNNIEGDISYTNSNSLTITLSSPASGYAYLT